MEAEYLLIMEFQRHVHFKAIQALFVTEKEMMKDNRTFAEIYEKMDDQIRGYFAHLPSMNGNVINTIRSILVGLIFISCIRYYGVQSDGAWQFLRGKAVYAHKVKALLQLEQTALIESIV